MGILSLLPVLLLVATLFYYFDLFLINNRKIKSKKDMFLYMIPFYGTYRKIKLFYNKLP